LKRFLLAISLTCLSMSLPCAVADAAPADLDLHYGRAGVVDVADPIPAYERWEIIDAAVAPDGSVYLLVGGCSNRCETADRLLVRYRPDGKPDHSFGDGAAKVVGPSPGKYVLPALTIDSADRPVVVLAGDDGLRVARFKKDGSPDRSFGVDGETFVSGWSTENTDRVAIDDGDLVIAGRILVGNCCSYESLLQVARLLPDGRPDPGFGGGGVATSVLPPGVNVEGPILVAPNGSVVVSGSSYPEGLGIVRFNAAGGFDDSFGPRIDAAFSGFPGLKPSFSTGMISRTGGRIDVLGSTEIGAPQVDGFVARLQPDGTPDRDFGRGGVKLLPFRVGGGTASPGGAGTVVGTGETPSFSHLVFRLRPNGSPDRTFDGGSLEGEQFGGEPVVLGVDSDDRLLIYDDEQECGRSECSPPEPKLFRLLGGVSRARCFGRRATIVGTRRGDALVGTPHRDVIAGLGGADTIEGKGGDDLICGGRGSDRLRGGPGQDRLHG
jgi:uncharacterized delta-60 repeat protein